MKKYKSVECNLEIIFTAKLLCAYTSVQLYLYIMDTITKLPRG